MWGEIWLLFGQSFLKEGLQALAKGLLDHLLFALQLVLITSSMLCTVEIICLRHHLISSWELLVIKLWSEIRRHDLIRLIQCSTWLLRAMVIINGSMVKKTGTWLGLEASLVVVAICASSSSVKEVARRDIV
jgi:hypothetical protein